MFSMKDPWALRSALEIRFVWFLLVNLTRGLSLMKSSIEWEVNVTLTDLIGRCGLMVGDIFDLYLVKRLNW